MSFSSTPISYWIQNKIAFLNKVNYSSILNNDTIQSYIFYFIVCFLSILFIGIAKKKEWLGLILFISIQYFLSAQIINDIFKKNQENTQSQSNANIQNTDLYKNYSFTPTILFDLIQTALLTFGFLTSFIIGGYVFRFFLLFWKLFFKNGHAIQIKSHYHLRWLRIKWIWICSTLLFTLFFMIKLHTTPPTFSITTNNIINLLLLAGFALNIWAIIMAHDLWKHRGNIQPETEIDYKTTKVTRLYPWLDDLIYNYLN